MHICIYTYIYIHIICIYIFAYLLVYTAIPSVTIKQWDLAIAR